MLYLRLCVYSVLIGLSGAIWMSNFSTIDIVTHATGTVVPFGKTRTLQNLEGGIVKDINVTQGDRVKAGDIIIELEELASKSEVAELETRIVFLNTEIITLKSVLSGKPAQYPEIFTKDYPNIVQASQDNAASTLALLNSEVELQQLNRQNLKRSVDIVENKISEKQEMASLLDKQIQISADLLTEKLTSELEHLDLLRSRQSINAEITEAEQNIQRLQSEIDDSTSTITVLKNEFDNQLKTKIQNYIEEEQKYASRLQRFEDELGRRVVKSPVEGIIKQLFVTTIGGVVGPGMDIAAIVPSNEALVIEAELPVSDVGFVSVGQDALIRLSGPHNSVFRPIQAKVAVISPDTLRTESNEAVYIVQLITDEAVFNSSDRSFNLYPGLIVDCSIVIGERTIIENLLAPFLEIQNSALKENVWQDTNMSRWKTHFSNIFNPNRWD